MRAIGTVSRLLINSFEIVPMFTLVSAASHYLWAMLLMELLAIRLGEQTTLAKSLVMARIYEALPLVCPICQAQMRIIAFKVNFA